MAITPLRPRRQPATPPHHRPSSTEQGVMREFVRTHTDKLRYDHDRGRWLVWEGHHWHPDRRKKAFFWALEHCNGLRLKKAERASFANAVESMARAMQPISTCSADWNPAPTLVACPSGVIDLPTGALRDGQPDDMIDRALAVSPDDNLPADTWFAFLDTMFDGNTEITDFLQRWCGYCLSGDISEQKFIFLFGTGANGKGTLLNTLQQIWNDLVATASVDVFLESQFERHSTEIARLHGVNLVLVNETREGKRWDEAKIKYLTGGDRVTARFMRRDDFEFTPRFKPVFAGNHRPNLRSVDEAIRRRLLLVPCTHTIPAEQRDPKLITKLQAEHPRILAWAIDGYQQWQRHGLKAPATIVTATNEYFEAQDDIQQWLDEKTRRNPAAKLTASALYADWKFWKENRGESPGTERGFNERLRGKGLTSRKTNTGVQFDGIEFSYATPP